MTYPSDRFEVGTRVTFKYDKRVSFGTVVEPRHEGETRVAWDHPHRTFGFPNEVGYRAGEVRAFRPREEERMKAT